jgi:hypothetical protein
MEVISGLINVALEEEPIPNKAISLEFKEEEMIEGSDVKIKIIFENKEEGFLKEESPNVSIFEGKEKLKSYQLTYKSKKLKMEIKLPTFTEFPKLTPTTELMLVYIEDSVPLIKKGFKLIGKNKNKKEKKYPVKEQIFYNLKNVNFQYRVFIKKDYNNYDSWVGLYQMNEDDITDIEEEEKQGYSKKVIQRNGKYLQYFKLTDEKEHLNFKIKINGKYFLRHFDSLSSYEHHTKTYTFENQMKNMFTVEYDEWKNSYLMIFIASWDPEEDGTWVGVYKNQFKEYQEYETYFNVKENEFKVMLNGVLNKYGVFNIRIFQNLFDKTPVITKDFEIKNNVKLLGKKVFFYISRKKKYFGRI